MIYIRPLRVIPASIHFLILRRVYYFRLACVWESQLRDSLPSLFLFSCSSPFLQQRFCRHRPHQLDRIPTMAANPQPSCVVASSHISSHVPSYRLPPTSSGSTTKLPNFIAYALHRTKLHSSVTFAALVLLQHLKARFPMACGLSGHHLFISAFMIASMVICDDTYSNKSVPDIHPADNIQIGCHVDQSLPRHRSEHKYQPYPILRPSPGIPAEIHTPAPFHTYQPSKHVHLAPHHTRHARAMLCRQPHLPLPRRPRAMIIDDNVKIVSHDMSPGLSIANQAALDFAIIKQKAFAQPSMW